MLKPYSEQGIKRKLVDYDDTESEMEDIEKNDEISQDSHQILTDKESKDDPDLPIALRRSRRGHRTNTNELYSSSSSINEFYSPVRVDRIFEF